MRAAGALGVRRDLSGCVEPDGQAASFSRQEFLGHARRREQREAAAAIGREIVGVVDRPVEIDAFHA